MRFLRPSVILAVALIVAGCSAHPRAAVRVRHWDPSAERPSSIPAVVYEEPHPDTLTVRLIGDVMLHGPQIRAARIKAARPGGFDFRPFLDSIAADLRAADIAVANMEFTLAGEPYSGYPTFSAPDSYADYVADCGVDIFLTANNHILDKGRQGLRRTLSVYDSLERAGRIRYTGCAMPGDSLHNPLIVEAKGMKIAFVNFTYGTNYGVTSEDYIRFQSRETVLPMIEKARACGADAVIVCPHWGIEYETVHGSAQERWARDLAEAGADAIVGAHPHVVQDTAVLTTSDGRSVPVYYSIGNAVSNQSSPGTQDELMVTLKISEGRVVGHYAERLRCTRPGELTSSYCVVKR